MRIQIYKTKFYKFVITDYIDITNLQIFWGIVNIQNQIIL